MVKEISFLIEGETTPLSLAKAIIDSHILDPDELNELIQYIEVYVAHHIAYGTPNREAGD